MFLDNIENVQASGTTQGLKVLQMGLRFGANDVGPVRPEAGSEEDVRRIIRDAGFRPAQRDMAYRAMMLR
jgi:cyclic dehypoxanthinyl futalosine synthase